MKEKKISRRTFVKSAGAAGLAASVLGFPAIIRSSVKVSEVEIACIYPLSGHAGASGNNAVRGWSIAIDEINAEGGIKSLGGAKIKAVLGDTQSSPRIGMAEIEKVAGNKNIPVVIGCWASAVTYPATQVSEQYKMPHIVANAVQAEIMRRGFKYVFRITPPTDTSVEAPINFVEDMGKMTGKVAKTAALISLDDNFGRSSAEDFKNAIKKKTKQEIVAEIYYPPKTTNLDVEIAKLKAAKPDVIYATSFVTDAVLIVKALQGQKVNTLGIMAYGAGFVDPKYLELVGPLGNYISTITNWNYGLTRPWEMELNTKMRKIYGVDANHHSANLYSAVYVIKDALERAGTIDREKVRDAIKATNITSGRALVMPTKFIRFDERGENIGAESLVAQCIDGKYQVVWPSEYKPKSKPVWPIPKWEER